MENIQEEFNNVHEHIENKGNELHRRFDDIHGHLDQVVKITKFGIVCIIVSIVLNIAIALHIFQLI